jgi:putative two-component system response regulator
VTQHVVIVDDDDLSLKLFTSIAGEIAEVVVHAFRSSTDALKWSHGQDVDCFVFDYNMPAPNGLQMIWAIRAMPEFALVPIVLVTGAHEREVRYKALDAGATDFLQKPVDLR